MSSTVQLHRELCGVKAEVNRLKMTVSKITELLPKLVHVTSVGDVQEVANAVYAHNAALDELILLVLHDDAPPVVVYGHDREPCMAIDGATLEIHDEY